MVVLGVRKRGSISAVLLPTSGFTFSILAIRHSSFLVNRGKRSVCAPTCGFFLAPYGKKLKKRWLAVGLLGAPAPSRPQIMAAKSRAETKSIS